MKLAARALGAVVVGVMFTSLVIFAALYHASTDMDAEHDAHRRSKR